MTPCKILLRRYIVIEKLETENFRVGKRVYVESQLSRHMKRGQKVDRNWN